MDQNSILTVSTLLDGHYNLSDVYLSVPCIVNKNGVDKILTLPMTTSEKILLNNSANIIKDEIESISIEF